MYAALFDFRAPCPQTKILIFQGSLKPTYFKKLKKFKKTKNLIKEIDFNPSPAK